MVVVCNMVNLGFSGWVGGGGGIVAFLFTCIPSILFIMFLDLSENLSYIFWPRTRMQKKNAHS
jgi:hypothetical protein